MFEDARSKFSAVWLFLVDIVPKKDKDFLSLVDGYNADDAKQNLDAAYANILVKASDQGRALYILEKGLEEKDFNIKEVSSVDNVRELVIYGNIEQRFFEEAEWLIKSNFLFKIIDPIYPYDSTLEDE